MEKITLSNGFRIMLDYVDWARSCTMGVWVGSGSGFEDDNHAGASHFIEHMLFKGTSSRSAFDIATQMDEIGGALNAYTTKEYTCFYCRSLTDHVDKAFDIIGDMLTDPRLDEKDIDLEKGVIVEEIAMYEDSPDDLCLDTFYENAWAGNPFGRNILGSRDTVNAATAADLRKHMSEFYVPERMVASFCGNFDKDSVVAACEKFFGSAKPTNNPIKKQEISFSPFVKTISKDFEQNQLIVGLKGVGADDKNRYSSSLICSILGGSTSSRLFQRIREELGLVYSVDAFNAAYLNGGIFGISMGLAQKAEEQALKEVFKILRDFPQSITPEELSRAQEQAAATMVMGLEGTPSRASRMGRSELLFNFVEDEDKMIENYRAITYDEIKSDALALLDLNKVAFCSVGKVNEESFYSNIINNK